MILAEHVLGIPDAGLGRYAFGDEAKRAQVAAAQRRHFEQVKASGRLQARGKESRGFAEPGSQFDYDCLAGDGRYVFLSAGPRYRGPDGREPELTYGFAFDARHLVEELGALVGHDLLSEYTALLDHIAEEVDATLPPAPRITDEELAEFAEFAGIDDPDLLASIQEDSTSNFYDLVEAAKRRDTTVPGVESILRLWAERLPALHAAHRKRGAEALCLLEEANGDGSLEILVEGSLDLSLALATIEAGELI